MTNSASTPASKIAAIHTVDKSLKTLNGIRALKDNNYEFWAPRMEAVLIRKGMWKVISGRERAPATTDADELMDWVDRQAEVCAELILSVEDGQLAHMSSPDPNIVWEELKRVHEARGLSTKLALTRTFLRMSKREDEAMVTWIGRVRSIATKRKAISAPCDDLFIIVVLTSGLPTTYQPLIVTLDSLDATALTVKTVITRLLNEEAQQLSEQTAAQPATASSKTTAAAVLAEVRCFNCNKLGHYKSVCPQPLKAPKIRDTSNVTMELDDESNSDEETAKATMEW